MRNQFANYVGRNFVILVVLAGVSAVVGCPNRPAVVSIRVPILTLTLNNELNISCSEVESPLQMITIGRFEPEDEIDRAFVKRRMDELASDKPTLICVPSSPGDGVVYVAHSIKSQKVEFKFSLDVPVMIDHHLVQDSIPLECGVHAFKLTFSDDHVDVEHFSDLLDVRDR